MGNYPVSVLMERDHGSINEAVCIIWYMLHLDQQVEQNIWHILQVNRQPVRGNIRELLCHPRGAAIQTIRVL